MFELRVPESMQALPSRRISPEKVRDIVEARKRRLEHMREYYKRNRINVRSQQQKRRLDARIASCQDPIVRQILTCYREGQSVETIAKAAGMGTEVVRKIIHPKPRAPQLETA